MLLGFETHFEEQGNYKKKKQKKNKKPGLNDKIKVIATFYFTININRQKADCNETDNETLLGPTIVPRLAPYVHSSFKQQLPWIHFLSVGS